MTLRSILPILQYLIAISLIWKVLLLFLLLQVRKLKHKDFKLHDHI